MRKPLNYASFSRLAGLRQALILAQFAMSRPYYPRIAIACVLLALVIGVLIWQRFAGFRPRDHSVSDNGSSVPAAEIFNRARSGLHNTAGSRIAERVVQNLREQLEAIPRSEQIVSLRRFLESGKDESTRMGFELNADGSLAKAPTLRTMALDQLTALDPHAAAAVAKRIFESKTSSDEWAVALRACARADTNTATIEFLKSRAQEMVQYGPWRTNPSVGFLEAFDVFVYTRDAEFAPDLAGMIRDTANPAVAHAAFLALDRLTQSEPAAILQSLLENPALLEGREATRAGLFARADVRHPAQQELLAKYLLLSDRAPAELNSFASLFPNANFMISHNLLTQSATLTGDELRARDAAAWKMVNAWLADAKFQRLDPQLNQIRSRLEQFGASTSR